MIVTTTHQLDGYTVTSHLGVVRGIVVRMPNIKQGLLGGLKSIVGGQIGAYSEMCEHARMEAHDLMIKHAEEMGADAVVAMQYDTGEIGQGATEVLCYGTAVKMRRTGGTD